MAPFAGGVHSDGPLPIIPRDQWQSVIEANEQSDRAFWAKPTVDARVLVELPFWIMSEDLSCDIEFEGCVVKLTTHSDYVEVVSHGQYFDSKVNLLYMGTESGIDETARSTWTMPVYRHQKTVVEIPVRVNEAAFDEYFSEVAREANRSRQYFEASASAQLPFVNLLISAYRAASRDPFAFEVSAWDVPHWWFEYNDRLARLELMSYWNSDTYPHYRTVEGEERHFFGATVPEVVAASKNPPSPHHQALLDALSLFVRGQYSDAIRSSVTAIEAVLEFELRSQLSTDGMTEQDINLRLQGTKDSFHARLDDFVNTSRRRLPGPIVAPFPHLNGLRLEEELHWVRQRRHEMVHEGVRVTDEGETLRAVETTTWLYDWFTSDAAIPPEHLLKYEFYSFMRGMPGSMSWNYNTDHVEVYDVAYVEREGGASPPIADEVLTKRFYSLLHPGRSDLELFVRMAFRWMGVELEESPAEVPGDERPQERYRFDVDSGFGIIYLLDFVGLPTDQAFGELLATLSDIRSAEKRDLPAIAVVHHERDKPLARRRLATAIPDSVVSMAASGKVTIVTDVELWRLCSGLAQDAWTIDAARAALTRHGRASSTPPKFSRIGTIRKHFAKKGAISVSLDGETRLEVGDSFYVDAPETFRVEEVRTLQVVGAEVSSVTGPLSVGIGVSGSKALYRVGRAVYARSS